MIGELTLAFWSLAKAFVFAAYPFPQVEVNPAQTVIECRPAEVAEIVDPAADVGIKHSSPRPACGAKSIVRRSCSELGGAPFQRGLEALLVDEGIKFAAYLRHAGIERDQRIDA